MAHDNMAPCYRRVVSIHDDVYIQQSGNCLQRRGVSNRDLCYFSVGKSSILKHILSNSMETFNILMHWLTCPPLESKCCILIQISNRNKFEVSCQWFNIPFGNGLVEISLTSTVAFVCDTIGSTKMQT